MVMACIIDTEEKIQQVVTRFMMVYGYTIFNQQSVTSAFGKLPLLKIYLW